MRRTSSPSMWRTTRNRPAWPPAISLLSLARSTARPVFRVDHALGMATVQNLLAARLANRVLEPVWNSTHIERVDILWDETLALEGRASYYDKTGALKDVIQNHLLQILCLIAMEPPISLGERDFRDRKLDVLQAWADDGSHCGSTQPTRPARHPSTTPPTVARMPGERRGDPAHRDRTNQTILKADLRASERLGDRAVGLGSLHPSATQPIIPRFSPDARPAHSTRPAPPGNGAASHGSPRLRGRPSSHRTSGARRG